MSRHIDIEKLAGAAARTASEKTRREVETHIASCPGCAGTYALLQAAFSPATEGVDVPSARMEAVLRRKYRSIAESGAHAGIGPAPWVRFARPAAAALLVVGIAASALLVHSSRTKASKLHPVAISTQALQGSLIVNNNHIRGATALQQDSIIRTGPYSRGRLVLPKQFDIRIRENSNVSIMNSFFNPALKLYRFDLLVRKGTVHARFSGSTRAHAHQYTLSTPEALVRGSNNCYALTRTGTTTLFFLRSGAATIISRHSGVSVKAQPDTLYSITGTITPETDKKRYVDAYWRLGLADSVTQNTDAAPDAVQLQTPSTPLVDYLNDIDPEFNHDGESELN